MKDLLLFGLNRKLATFAIVVAISAMAVPVVLAHGSIDQEYWDDSDIGLCISGDSRWGQGFTPTGTNVDAVDVGLSSIFGTSTDDLTITIHEGTLFGPIIGSETFSDVTTTAHTLIDPYEVVHFDFSSPIAIVAGSQYVLEVHSDAPGFCDRIWDATVSGSYAGGDAGIAAWDAFFATYTASNKADVLKGEGVPGKGIENAPGLQKEFNPNGKAKENVSSNAGGRTVSPQ